MDKIQKINMSDMMESLHADSGVATGNVYMSEGLGMIRGANAIFRKILKPGVPFLIEEPRFILITEGWVRVTANLKEQTIRKGMACYIGTGCIIQVDDSSISELTGQPEINGKGFAVSDEVLQLALHGRLPQSFDGLETFVCVEIREACSLVVSHLLDSLWIAAHNSDTPKQTLHGLVASVAYLFDSVIQKKVSEGNGKTPRNREIFDRFIRLVNRHCTSQHLIGFYADSLCVSPRYLGTVVKMASGVTAKEWIDRALIMKAKVLLRHTGLQTTEIAYKLNFPSNSFFCKYF